MWDHATPIVETLHALNDLVRLGKVRYLGASNLTGWQMQKIVEISKQNNWVSWISLQVSVYHFMQLFTGNEHYV